MMLKVSLLLVESGQRIRKRPAPGLYRTKRLASPGNRLASETRGAAHPAGGWWT